MVSKIKFTYFTADARVLSFRSAIIQLCSCFGLATVLKTKYMGKTSDGTGSTGSTGIIHEFIYLSNSALASFTVSAITFFLFARFTCGKKHVVDMLCLSALS